MSISSDLPDTAPGQTPAIATACGKVILFGEHSVVYGEPALALPLPPLRLSVVLARGHVAFDSARLSPNADFDAADTRQRLPAVGTTLDEPSDRPLTIDLEDGAPDDAHANVSRALGATAAALNLAVPLPLRVAVRTGGLRSGMGTSAALGVAMARALLLWHGHRPDHDRVLDAAEAVERLFHGNPSGIDHTVSALEAPLWFRKGEEPEVLQGLMPLHLVLLRRQSESATSVIVRGVRDRLADEPSLVRTLADMGRIARECRGAWERGDLSDLAAGLAAQQGALDRLGVVADSDRDSIAVALEAGALAAKITGAGGGGSVLALSTEDGADAIAEAWGERALVFVTQ